jgi:hypothetical protein
MKKKKVVKSTTYNMIDEQGHREITRKLLSLLTNLKELGYPVRCFLLTNREEIQKFLNITEEKKDYAIIELLKLKPEILEEVLEFMKLRGITVISNASYNYADGPEVDRITILISTLK